MSAIPEDDLRTKEYPVVYLTSYPRSGNQLLRRLIEEATGVLTSSAYPDPDTKHSEKLYPWHGYVKEGGYEGNRRFPEKYEIVALKTHYPAIITCKPPHEPPNGKAVRIVRHPIDSIYSLYLYVCPGRPEPTIPQNFLENSIKTWRVYQEYWNRQEGVQTFRFEDLMVEPSKYLKMTIAELGYRATKVDIQRAIEKYPPNSPTLKHASHYTEEQVAFIDRELRPLLDQFGYTLPQTTLRESR